MPFLIPQHILVITISIGNICFGIAPFSHRQAPLVLLVTNNFQKSVNLVVRNFKIFVAFANSNIKFSNQLVYFGLYVKFGFFFCYRNVI